MKYKIANENKNAISNIFNKAKKEKKSILTTEESLNILRNYGIRISKQAFATKGIEEIKTLAKKLNYPLTMKISSKEITHKKDIGGVITNIMNENQLIEEYEKLINNLKNINKIEGLEGLILQEFIVSQKELIIGITKDPEIGHLIMFGVGGIYIEIINDVSTRVCPITNIDAKEMIKEIKYYKILEGVRGTKKVNLDQIEDTICRINDLVSEYGFIEELDINPILIDENTGDIVAVDCRFKINIEE